MFLLKNSPKKVEDIKLVKAYYMVKKLKLSFVLSRLFSSFGKEFIREKLLGGKVSLRYLDMYKLGLLLEKQIPPFKKGLFMKFRSLVSLLGFPNAHKQ